MADIGNALAVLEATAGVSPHKVSFLIRTIFLSLVFLWAGYVVCSRIHHFRHQGIDELDATRQFFGMLFVVMLAIILVYGV